MSNDRLKFRVWSELLSMYVSGVCLHQDGQYSNTIETCDQERDIFEQCTGLKDKSGKLIYEGDILKFQTENEWGDTFDYVKPVVYHNDLSLFGFPVTISGSYKTPIKNYANALYQADWNSEVIGNIHESGDLLDD